MSFNDIHSSVPSSTPSSGSSEDAELNRLHKSLSLQVFKINANVQGILKLVDQLGTTRDSAALRKSLHDLTETTKAMAKHGSEDLTKLTALQIGEGRTKAILQKTTRDVQLSIVAFQRVQHTSAERQRTVLEGVKLAVEAEQPDLEQAKTTSPSQRQAQILQSQLSPHELAYQESLIQERENDIREIESGILDVDEIFRDLRTLVNEQDGMLDVIGPNIKSVATGVQHGSEELALAAEDQRKARRRATRLGIIIVVVVALVLLVLLN